MTDRQAQPKAKDAERPLHAPDAREAAAAQSVPAAPLSPGYAPPDPKNPNTLQLRRANVTQMQRSLGNARVARKLAQRDDPPAASAAPAAPSSAAAGLIVDDAATDIQPGQMTKSAFLAQLRSAVEATAAAELADSPLLGEARSQIDQQFAQYSALSGPALEQAVKREVPAAAGATTAQAYIAPICARVRTTIAEQRAALPPGAEAVAGVASDIADAASSVASAASSALSSIGSIFFKAREGGAQAPEDPRAVQAQLGTGHALDSRVQSGLESALGQNFGGVRVHSDSHAGTLSDQMNARAFTVGQDIAFGSGEYQPGTLFGDALIAHEVAHVAQQSGAGPAAVQQKGAGDYGALEADADQSAVGAMAAMWGGLKGGLSKIGQNALPQLKSGLRLQKCGGKAAGPEPATPTKPQFDWPKLEALLQKSNLGGEALQIKQKYNVEVTLQAGEGRPAYFLPESNKCFVNSTMSIEAVAGYFVHEMHHANQFHSGKSPDAASVDEETFVKTMVQEEIDGTVKAIEAKFELEKVGAVPTRNTELQGEAEYRSAYNYAKEKALKEHQSPEEAHRLGQENGRRMVRFLIQPPKGERQKLGPNQFDSYAEYYRREWKQKNKAKTP